MWPHTGGPLVEHHGRVNKRFVFFPYVNPVGDSSVVARFLRCESGATAIEYCLIAGLISIVIVTAATQIGFKINAKFYGPLGSAFN